MEQLPLSLQWQSAWHKIEQRESLFELTLLRVQCVIAVKTWQQGKQQWLQVWDKEDKWCSRTFLFSRGPKIIACFHPLSSDCSGISSIFLETVLNYVRCVQSFVSMVILNPVKLTEKFNNWKRREKWSYPFKIKTKISLSFCIHIETNENQKYRIEHCNKSKRWQNSSTVLDFRV